MAWTLTTSGAAILKAGVNANSTIVASGAALLSFSNEAEGRIEGETRRLWVSGYSGLDDGMKNVLSDVCSSLIAMQIMSYDMSGYTSRQEVGTMLDVQDDRASKGLQFLKDFKSGDIKDV